ncbi:ATP-binding protein [Mesorhizobium sp. M0019]|uniref:ATP-binding protein n=1 Tax=unclassified Mesorhizobium TaxID=325217 RepID=UPI00333BEC8B
MSELSESMLVVKPRALLEPENIKSLLGWVPGHQRKFTEIAASTQASGWQNNFPKERAFESLTLLLAMPDGLVVAEDICSRAGIRGVEEAIFRLANVAIRRCQADAIAPEEQWPAILADAGYSREADWLLWYSQQKLGAGAGQFVRPLVETHQNLRDLLTPKGPVESSPTTPLSVVGDEWQNTLQSLETALTTAIPYDENLPSLLRKAAQDLELIAAKEQERASALTAQLLNELETLKTQRSGNSRLDADATTALDTAVAHMPSLGIGGQAAAESVLAAARAYGQAAKAWSTAHEALRETADYESAGKAHSGLLQALRDLQSEVVALTDMIGLLPETAFIAAPPPFSKGEQEHDSEQDAVVAKQEIDSVELIVANNDTLNLVERDVMGVEITTAIDSAEDSFIAEEPAAPDFQAKPEHELVPTVPNGERLSEDELLAPGGEWGAEQKAELAAGALRAVATSLSTKRFGLALHSAKVAQAGGIAFPFGFSASLLDALVCGLAIGTPRSERAIESFGRQRDTVVRELTEGADRHVQLIAFAAALRPALFAIEAGAEAVLKQTPSLPTLGEGLFELVRFANETVRTGEIVPSELSELRDRLATKRELESLRQELDRFFDDARRKTIKFHRATVIWTSLLRVGTVHDALSAVIKGSPNAAGRVAAALGEELSDIDKLIADSDREAMKGRKAQPLTAGPRATLRDWIEDIADRLRAWQRLNEMLSRPEPNRFGLQNREELRTALQKAQKDLDGITSGELTRAANGNGVALQLAAGAALEAVMSVLQLFEGEEPPRLSLEMRYNDELLLLSHAWHPNDADRWTDAERAAFFSEVEISAGAPSNFMEAFERALAGGHFPQAIRARDHLLLDRPADRDALDAQLNGERDRKEEAARRDLAKVRKRLNDLLGADDRQILSRDLEPDLDKLAAVLRSTDVPTDLADWNAELRVIDAKLDAAFKSLLGPLHERLNQLVANGREVGDLRKMEELKDLTTLAEHIDAYEKGANPPDPPANLLEAFSRQFLNRQDRRVADLSALQRAVDQRQAIESVDFSTFDEGQLNSASGLLKAWRELRGNDGKESGPQLERLFSVLLTSNVSVSQVKPSTFPGHYTLKTPTFADREECVAPAFGSAAQGRYDIVLVESRNVGSGVEPAQLKSRVNAPTFFVIRGPMPAAALRNFMVQVRGKGANPACALIDEALVLFLATRATRRRSDLFNLSMAMGVVQPYSDTAQQTSPEMFFGRSDELRELWDPNGSCLVYGGRQLGKTALLRQIELRHNSANQIVIYGDQMVQGFGSDQPTSFWRWIGKEARARGVSIPQRADSEGIKAAIRNWLASDSTSRLLFLIDEADAFLRSEIRNGFTVLLEVRELMRVTDRRCKFVFAGLHDVQRLARAPNSPLLHFGNPIRVGPLMGKDLFEARSMVEQPMAAAGYAFGNTAEAGRALIGRALSEVGYYPSLMQTFGMVLVNRLNGRASTRIESPAVLPIRIGETELNEALDDNSFRDSVRTKFDNTLNLDQRYRLIAYLVLLGTQESADRKDVRPGMSIAEIQADAMFWWPQGFAEDASNSAFEGLLKEMEGLGVLVGLSDGRYAIRSARIAAMLGPLQEVGDKVQELADQPYEVVHDTGSSRRLVDGGPSPLTFRQESVLFETLGAPPITIALSSAALGLMLLPKAVAEIAKADDRLLTINLPASSVRELERAISVVSARMKQNQRGLLIAHGPWLGREAVDAVSEHKEVRRAQRNSAQGVRVILLPRIVDWQELDGEDFGDRLWEASVLTLATLHEGGLRQWLSIRCPASVPVQGAIERLRTASGGFPALLTRIPGRTAEEFIANAETAAEVLLEDSEAILTEVGLLDSRLRSTAQFVLDQADGSFSAADRDTIVSLMEDANIRSPASALDVLERLGILDRTTEINAFAGWQLNPLVARLLSGRLAA